MSLDRIDLKTIVISFLFIFFFEWWLLIQIYSPLEDIRRYYFTSTYGLTAIIGSIFGFFIANRWEWYRSLIGKSILFFSSGLLFQGLGQLSYTVYSLIYNVEAPYPSFGDIFYFGSIPLYIYGVWILSKAIGTKQTLKSLYGKAIAILIPLIIVSISYFIFLPEYQFKGTDLLTILLDFGYPIGQAIFISFSIVAYLLSYNTLGGLMKRPTLLILFSLLVQYEADFTFSYQEYHGTWVPGGYNDLSYFLAYFLMTLALLNFNTVINKLNKNTSVNG